MCVETPTILGKDNPIFDQVPYTYIPGFDVPDTREMVRKLGRIMGLKFDEIIYGKLTEDFGGHPFLIRHICSVINRITSSTRPSYIDKTIYEKAKALFKNESGNYIEMILEVLEQYYIDEYEMLKMLSVDDLESFKEFASLSPTYTNHLLGYGIVNHFNGEYSYKIELVKEYLSLKQKYKKTENCQSTKSTVNYLKEETS
ncbi:hypothetical protein HMSSN139_12000 [Paenibacillus sp. HMSSN-139]|nr:hypothetical protein HMSSN139_12000 [Paenibacillus sp. HMSSN-139]